MVSAAVEIHHHLRNHPSPYKTSDGDDDGHLKQALNYQESFIDGPFLLPAALATLGESCCQFRHHISAILGSQYFDGRIIAHLVLVGWINRGNHPDLR
jgi:hypothetical protein